MTTKDQLIIKLAELKCLSAKEKSIAETTREIAVGKQILALDKAIYK